MMNAVSLTTPSTCPGPLWPALIALSDVSCPVCSHSTITFAPYTSTLLCPGCATTITLADDESDDLILCLGGICDLPLGEFVRFLFMRNSGAPQPLPTTIAAQEFELRPGVWQANSRTRLTKDGDPIYYTVRLVVDGDQHVWACHCTAARNRRDCNHAKRVQAAAFAARRGTFDRRYGPRTPVVRYHWETIAGVEFCIASSPGQSRLAA